jgi:hypothetical protein
MLVLTYISFLIAVSTSNMHHKVNLRSYATRAGPPSDITVVDAILATCATQGNFLPVTIGSGPTQQELMGGAMGAANPCHEAVQEALDRFKPDRRIAVVLSIGSGHPGLVSASSSTRYDEWLRVMKDMAANCEQASQEMTERMGKDGVYFRFSVEQGLQTYHGTHVHPQAWITSQTLAYLKDRETSRLLDQCISGICQRQGLLALEEVDTRIRAKFGRQTSCSGDITFSKFTAKLDDTTDVLLLVRDGCELLQHVVEVAKVRGVQITIYVAYSTLQGN